MNLKIFYSETDKEDIRRIQRALTTAYKDIVNITIGGELALPNNAYNSLRNQYNADILLKYLITTEKKDYALWVVTRDLYCMGMNFVFGYAMHHKGAILSIFRLASPTLIEKEAIHEIGHVVGLHHCNNPCVMQFSNSLAEAKTKPAYLCDRCKRKIMSLKI
jgi:archaemetzincin